MKLNVWLPCLAKVRIMLPKHIEREGDGVSEAILPVCYT